MLLGYWAKRGTSTLAVDSDHVVVPAKFPHLALVHGSTTSLVPPPLTQRGISSLALLIGDVRTRIGRSKGWPTDVPEAKPRLNT